MRALWITLGVAGLVVLAVGTYAGLRHLAGSSGTRKLHEEGRKTALGTRYAFLLNEFRYPDTLLFRIEGELGRPLTLAELREFCAPGDIVEEPTAAGVRFTCTFRRWGFVLYVVRGEHTDHGERVGFSVETHEAAWHPRSR